ncbi:hypothetical protein ACP4OV_008424 [Aristida adscensionis]
MWEQLVPTIDAQHSGLVVSVSSLLIMLALVLHSLVKTAVAASRSVCSAAWAAATLLARDDSAAVVADDDHRGVEAAAAAAAAPPRRRHYCERCARRGTPLSVFAVAVASLGMAASGGGGHGGDDEEAFVNGGGGEHACAGCEAAATVEELLVSKVAGEGELREAFYVFDRDEDGFVDAAELWNVMRRLGLREGAAYEDCRRMIAVVDGDGDGRVSFHEFRVMMENAV